MNTGLGKILGNIFSSSVQTQFVPVRYRYYAEKIARGPCAKKFGYEDKVSQSGAMPRLKDAKPLPMAVYRPANAWSKEKVLNGRNDYIDLLGGGKLYPPYISYDVPKWLRGQKGNELQLLLLKQKVFSRTLYEAENPTMWSSMSRRVRYLYSYLNRKTKTGFSKRQ